MSRRPSVSIYNYPEDLNPFSDDATMTTTNGTKQTHAGAKNSIKEPKHKFWTFGRSKKKQRSNSFSIKSTWSGLFGKRKDSQEVEIRKPTIATVSSTYKRGTYNGYPVGPARLSKDQQEFDEALGTLARRRKYTLDNSSRYSSTVTVNGDPGRIYEGSPRDTTASIMGDLTPKAPARRFGQVSPKPTDKLPPLDYSGKERTRNGSVLIDEGAPNRTPVPPKRGGGPRSSQRSLPAVSLNDDLSSRSVRGSLTDENENVPEDRVSKRFSHEAMRKSNLSINSCVSVGSTVSAYGRKKRRAPQPPRIKEPLEAPKEKDVDPRKLEEPKNRIEESTGIARVTENIDEMRNQSRESYDNLVTKCWSRSNDDADDEIFKILADSETQSTIYSADTGMPSDDERTINVCDTSKLRKTSADYEVVVEEASWSPAKESNCTNSTNCTINPRENINTSPAESKVSEDYRTIEIECNSSMEDFPLKRRRSSGNLSRTDSFSVKEEIEKIERQIKLLEAMSPRDNRENTDEDTRNGALTKERSGSTRLSLRETRRKFFCNMAEDERVKVQLRELPRQRNDVRIVRIEDSPIPVDGPTEPVKIIELHISEPIRQKPAVMVERDVNPIPKPRRHSNWELEPEERRLNARHEREEDDKRGNSL